MGWRDAPIVDAFDVALESEGIKGPLADVARSIYQQESGGGKNTKTSNAGAVGGMQIIPATFNRVADKGWNIADPVHNARAGLRYLKMLDEKAGGDPKLIAAGYYGGEGAIDKARKGIAVSDPRNPKAPNTLQYGEQVASRVQPKWMSAPIVEKQSQSKGASGSFAQETTLADDIEALGAGVGKGVGSVVLGAQRLVGKGLQKVGADSAGDWLVKDAEQGRENLKAELAPYKIASPLSAGTGELVGEIAGTMPVGGVAAKGLSMLPGATKIAPLINSIRTFGFKTGLNPTTGTGKLANLVLRSAGGGVTGYAAAGLVDPEQASTGGVIGATIPGVAAAGKYAGNTLKSLIQPLTSKGQDQIVNRVIEKFAKGGPIQANTAELVPGSLPTLSQATGNAGIARLENLLRDTNPNAFQGVAERNAAARAGAFADVAGDPSSIAALQAHRTQASVPLLNSALKNARAADATAPLLIDKILQGPRGGRTAVKSTLEQVRSKMFNPDGTPITDAATLYHSARKEITDLLDKRAALSNPGAQQATRELMAVKRALDRDINRAAPGFKDYLTKYADASKPIDAQQFLQSVNIADANGVIQLGKVQAAIRNIEKLQKARGANQAKSIAPDRIDVLYKIRDDLLRANKQHLGRSAGSNTRQNFALENILDNALPGPLRALQNPMGRLGKVSKVIYGSADEEIRNRLVDLLLNPANSRIVNNGQLRLLGQGAPKSPVRRLLPYNAPPVGGAGLLEEPY